MAYDFGKEVSALPANWVVLVETPAKDYTETSIDILRYMLGGGMTGIYVTINKPATSVQACLVKSNVPSGKVYFVDCVSKLVKADTKKIENTVFVDPQNLTGIALAINEMINAIKGEKFLYLDSLSTLLIYNSTGSVEKFSHFITSKIRLLNLKGIILTLEEDMNPEFSGLLNRICDKIIKI